MCSCNPSKPSENGAGDTDCDGGTECPKKPKVKVLIVPENAGFVACPGHPFQLTAVAEPAGGTLSWTISGGGNAELVDTAGNPKTDGDTVFLRGFSPDDSAGNIPERTATVKVTYTHPDGTAEATTTVKIHKIDFDVTNTTINAGVTQANEGPGGVRLANAPGVATMSTTPQVEIKLDASCPRKTDCARNHRVGWLQTVLTNTRDIRYPNTLLQVTVPLPIRDAIAGAPAPFYLAATPFTANNNKQNAHHEDSPGQGAPWTDARPGAPAPPPPTNLQLQSINFANSFTAWLVVQNIEWSVHHRDTSFVFVRNFDWSMSLNVTVDTTQAVGSRCTPASNPATIGTLNTGRGGSSPVLTAPIANTTATRVVTPLP